MQKWVMFGLFLAASALGVYLMMFGLPEKTAPEPEEAFVIPDQPSDIAAAEGIYKNSCLGCHGTDMQGGMGPALNQIGGTLTKEEIYKKIMGGGNGMPAFKEQLSSEQIANLSSWLAQMK
ncbi:c-type cytochrome [Paenibacillus sp. SYP-B4298]|uniref:c-type cytochrome n=1 Tax=Paenibacillus sp. SYP-B4298 TaxID=2996034 RepID=UPI0022DD6609|nr:cytochrome c [Paenibacillus sp. SYP-B4298]